MSPIILSNPGKYIMIRKIHICIITISLVIGNCTKERYLIQLRKKSKIKNSLNSQPASIKIKRKSRKIKTTYINRNIKGQIIRVLIAKKKRVTLRTKSKFKIINLKNNRIVKIGRRKVYIPALSQSSKYRITFNTGLFTLDGNTYRGNVVLHGNSPSGNILIVNELMLEEYLYGVLPAEMSADWPLEALKAQAICARTYAFKRMQDNINPFYDLDNGTGSQVYSGLSLETPNVLKAVNSTKNIVLENGGKLINGFFYSTCGGITERAANVWNESDYSTQIKKCPYCKHAKYYNWKSVSSKQRLNKLTAFYNIGRFKKIQPIKKSKSGRIIKIKLFGSRGKMLMSGNDFRIRLGADIIKSLRYKSKKSRNGGITFIGKGFGHGVGLCQYGAQKMAGNYKYQKILRFYFKNVKFRKLPV